MKENYKLIDTTQDLEAAAAVLSNRETFYIDTEFEGHNGSKTLCLLQIATDTDVFLIDCLRLTAMECLAAAIAAPDQEWVMHDGSIDVGLVCDKLGIGCPPRLFDTQVAWGLLGPEYSVSLSYLIYKVLGIRTTKEHQTDSWKLRPIPRPQLEYAAGDVEHIPAMRKELGKTLMREGKADLVHSVSRERDLPEFHDSGLRKPIAMADFQRKIWELDTDGLAALQFLIDWYNNLDPEEIPPGIKPYSLFLLARRMPETGNEAAAIKGVPTAWAKREGDILMGRMLRATYESRSEERPAFEPPPYATFGQIQTKAFVALARWYVCNTMNIAPDLAFPAWLQERLQARITETNDPFSGIAELTGWRQDWLTPPYEECCRKISASEWCSWVSQESRIA